MKAPERLPNPPTTTTTKASIPIISAIPGNTVRRGPAATPAIPASQVPNPNTPMNSREVLIPRAFTMSGSETAALTIIPSLVL